MAAPGPHATDLAASIAKGAQDSARRRPTREADTLLVIDRLKNTSENLVKPISSTALKEKVLEALIKDAPAATSKLPGSKKAERTAMMQNSCMVTECVFSEGSLTSMLPGGAAVIDHLATWCNDSPGWNALLPTINKLRSKRVPALSPSYHPEVFDLDLVWASEERYREATNWLRRKQEETRREYGFFIPAADVEAIQLEATTGCENLDAAIATMQLDTTDVMFPLHPGPHAKVSGTQLPVLFMYGGIGWQLHLRVTVSREDNGKGRKMVKFLRHDQLPHLNSLLTVMESAVGIGIEQDYQEFFSVLRALYGWQSNQLPAKPLDLARLCLLSGCAVSGLSLIRVAYTYFGGNLGRRTESDSYQPPRGYTPPGSYVPPTITGLHPATMEDRKMGRRAHSRTHESRSTTL